MVRLRKKKKIIRTTWKELLKNGNRLFFNVLVYSFIAFMLMKPIFNAGVKFAMDMAGYSYITIENIISFLFRPATLAVIAGLLFLCGCFLYYGISYIMLFIYATKQNKKNGISCHLKALKRVIFALRPRNLAGIFYSILVVISANITLIYGIVTRTRFTKYIAVNLLRLPYGKYILGAVGMILVVTVYFLIFTMPYCILEGLSFRSGVRNSISLLKKNRLRTIFYFFVWNGGIAVISITIYLAALVGAAVGVAFLVKKTLAVAMFLSIYNQINFYTGFFVGIIGIVVNIGLFTYLYFTYKEEQQEDYTEPEEVLIPRKKIARKTLILLVFCFLFADILYTYDTVKNGAAFVEKNMEYIGITSHRGDSASAPENTLPAIEMAIENLADYVEIDVQQTRDGVVMLLHDASLKRTAGLNKPLWSVDYEAVRQLDAGSWFGREFEGTPIPTLEEVLKMCKGKINLNIELKYSTRVPGLEEKVAELIKQYNYERQCVITSTSAESLRKIKEQNPELRTGYIISVAYGNFYDKEEIDFFSMKSSFLNEALVGKLHGFGKEIHAWTVNNRRELERMKRLNVDNIITDRPVYAREIVYQEETNKNFIELLNVVLKWKE